ncbi:hypothetical protein QU487_02555 [Crenobacter sp. SG2305]|uniref:hypothetical protein n=1 Tax=Crenobacter oryzisoli TaxID=3056844 RepID=UPI0025AB40B8|nr:hypothetical protein [Crenobacter sp. SG2305]MDN0081642.1 hypothetical protein [Crenobacter sp. SG2305]
MRKTIIAIALSLSSTAAFAVNTCDTMPTKNQRNDCWSTMIGNGMQEADEYVSAVQESHKVPASVKRKVNAKRQAIASDANRQCKKDDLGYPENSCYIEQIQKFKDFTYNETSKYGVPDKRLN